MVESYCAHSSLRDTTDTDASLMVSSSAADVDAPDIVRLHVCDRAWSAVLHLLPATIAFPELCDDHPVHGTDYVIGELYVFQFTCDRVVCTPA